MRFLLVFLALFIGLKTGWDYLNSEKFQNYGDRAKAEWTCRVDFWLAEYLTVLSRYDSASRLFLRASQRCEKTLIGEECAFEYAHSLETGGKRQAAVDAYLAFIEAYPESPRAKLAQKSVDMLRSS